MPIDFIQQHLFLIAVCLGSLFAFLYLTFKGKTGEAVNNSEATLLMNRENALFIDVRNKDEFIKGHIPGARHLALENFQKTIESLNAFKETPIIAYCASGVRTEKALKLLKSAQFQKLYQLEGGFDAWSSAGYPVKKGM